MEEQEERQIESGLVYSLATDSPKRLIDLNKYEDSDDVCSDCSAVTVTAVCDECGAM